MKKEDNNILNEGGMFGTGGAIATMGAINPGYSYSIKGFSHSLEQKIKPQPEEYYVYPGCKVRGYAINDIDTENRKTYTGTVIRLVKDFEGAIRAIWIRTDKTAKMLALTPDDLELLIVQETSPAPQYRFPVTCISGNIHN